MASHLRLVALPGEAPHSVVFYAAFAASAADPGPACAPAHLFPGDRQMLDLGELCAPAAATWRSQRQQQLATYIYSAPGAHTATLRWGDVIVTTVAGAEPAEVATTGPLPELALFELQPAPDRPGEAALRLHVTGLAAGQQVRVDAGAGHVHWLLGQDGPEQTLELVLVYVKPGDYSAAVDLLDGEGFWLATLAESSLQLAAPQEPVAAQEVPPAAPPAAPLAPPMDVPSAGESSPPWLPFRYARPAWSWARTVTAPGGSQVSRSLAPGTYLAIQAETMIDAALWYQSSYGDWIAASAVALMQPSELRGVELDTAPPPPPPPPGERRGVVTAAWLNVRARPGVGPDNPPIDRLPTGAEVTVYEEQSAGDGLWYRIGSDRWVHGNWVRLVEEPPPQTRRGVVTATQLNVRARPGVSPDNPPIDHLPQGAPVTIYEEQVAGGAAWYRIGPGRWVHSAWVRIVSAEALAEVRAVTEAATVNLPVGWVVAPSLHVRAQPNARPDNPPIDQVMHNQRLDILETRAVDGAKWYRIGEERWVSGQWVAVARLRSRPSAIRPDERWVGVNLSEQTAVAYEGDRPVYAAMIASGLPATPTVQGIFRTWRRLPSGKMSGGSASTGGYYYLEEVTWTCYFYSGYALHTAYWHDAFGRPRSHGCVNLSPYDAWWIFQWSAAGGPNSPAVYVYWS